MCYCFCLLLVLLFNTVPSFATPPTPKIYSVSSPYTIVLPGQEVFLKARFSDPDTGESYLVKWNMGDGTVRTETLQTTHDTYANPGRCSPYRYGCFAILNTSHAYNESGSYSISLFVTDSKGEEGKDEVSLLVMSPEALLQQLSSAFERLSPKGQEKEMLAILERACTSGVHDQGGKNPEAVLKAVEVVTFYLSNNQSSSDGEVNKALESLSNYLSRQKK